MTASPLNAYAQLSKSEDRTESTRHFTVASEVADIALGAHIVFHTASGNQRNDNGAVETYRRHAVLGQIGEVVFLITGADELLPVVVLIHVVNLERKYVGRQRGDRNLNLPCRNEHAFGDHVAKNEVNISRTEAGCNQKRTEVIKVYAEGMNLTWVRDATEDLPSQQSRGAGNYVFELGCWRLAIARRILLRSFQTRCGAYSVGSVRGSS